MSSLGRGKRKQSTARKLPELACAYAYRAEYNCGGYAEMRGGPALNILHQLIGMAAIYAVDGMHCVTHQYVPSSNTWEDIRLRD